MAKAPQSDIATVDGHELAALFGIGVEQIHKIAREGHVIRMGRGRYALFPSITKYVKHLQEAAGGRLGHNKDYDPVEENVRLKRAQRALIETRNKRESGEAISIPELTEVWGEIVKAVKSMVLSWPSRCAFELPHLTDHDKDVMRRVADEVLRSHSLVGSMSNGSIGPLPDLNSERTEWRKEREAQQ